MLRENQFSGVAEQVGNEGYPAGQERQTTGEIAGGLPKYQMA